VTENFFLDFRSSVRVFNPRKTDHLFGDVNRPAPPWIGAVGWYTSLDVRHWEELVDFIDKNGGSKEPYILTYIFKCTLEQDELEEEYMGIYKHGQMINDHIYGQILFNCCRSNAFKLNLGHNVKIFVVEMKRATGKEIAEHVIRPTKGIPLAVLRLDVSNCSSIYIDFGRFLRGWKRGRGGGRGGWWARE
jgi:hypothetical protein